jgi:hypothetical protein
MSDGEPTMKIWIIQRGSGKLQVHRSPVQLRPGDTFRVKNWTGLGATIEFAPEDVKDFRPLSSNGFSVPARGYSDFQVDPGAQPRFLEYDVEFPERHQYAEGNSKPGVIVDP